jgi:PAS domain-containing protein
MNSLLKTLSELFTPSLDDVQQRHERYLSKAVDMCDLETRMRHLDGGHASIYRSGPYGIFLR